MVKIFKNSNHKIIDIYENCIVNGDIHILRNTNFKSNNKLLKNNKKHFNGYENVQKAQEEIDLKDYVK